MLQHIRRKAEFLQIFSRRGRAPASPVSFRLSCFGMESRNCFLSRTMGFSTFALPAARRIYCSTRFSESGRIQRKRAFRFSLSAQRHFSLIDDERIPTMSCQGFQQRRFAAAGFTGNTENLIFPNLKI